MHFGKAALLLKGSKRRGRGLTLIEVLVAVVVLAILILIATQLVGHTGRVIASSNKTQSTDDQARLMFDRLAADFSGMVRRPDLDALFVCRPGDDRFFFYGEAPAYFDTANKSLFPGSGGADPKNSLSLVGYRINAAHQLERLGMGLTWDGRSSSSGPGSVVFLSWLNGVVDPASTLSGAYPTVIGSAPAYDVPDASTTSSYWQVMAAQIFRMELCFLLVDGTLSTIPAMKPSGVKSNLAASLPPSIGDGSGVGYAPGSRWFDGVASRGYVCLDSSAGAAVWQPLGVRDIRAVVVAAAVLDEASRKIVTAEQVASLARTFQDEGASDLASLPAVLMKQKWQQTLLAPSFSASAGVPPEAAARVRIYQRYFYLNAP